MKEINQKLSCKNANNTNNKSSRKFKDISYMGAAPLVPYQSYVSKAIIISKVSLTYIYNISQVSSSWTILCF